MKPIHLFLAAILAIPATAALTVTGVYDEQATQANAVDFSMPYSGNATWTTGIGQTLGAAQIRDLVEFKPLVETAFTTGNGGVISFDGVANADYNQVQSFPISFAGGSKQLTLRNRIGGTYSLAGPGGDRTAVSGSQYLGTGGNANFDLDFTDFTGFGPNEKITAVGVTILGRSGQGTGRNFRVAARFTNGVDNGSSSTFRTFDMQVGNGTQDSFSAIVAPTGYWITSIAMNSDSGIFTALDDLAFITSEVSNPDQAPSIVTDLPATREAPFNSMVNLSLALDPATSPPPSWRWEFDAAPEDGVFEAVPGADGGQNATLTFISGSAREGTYRVTATNSGGSVISGNCEFRVLPTAPLITTDLPSFLSPLVGQTVTLSVVVSPTAYPVPTFQWFFDDVEIPASQGGRNATFTFVAGPATDGSYYVDVANSEGVAFSSAVQVESLADSDEDGIPDIDESGTGIYVSPTDTGSDPNQPDTDGDGLLDGGNITVTSADPRHSAWAAAGVQFTDNGAERTFLGERSAGTDPNKVDTDGDGLLDGRSITLTASDPRYTEWADAGILFTANAGQRTFLGELDTGTNPLRADTDGDGISDGREINDGTNPLWYNDALEWRPAGLPGGNGTWNDTTANWFDGATPPGATTVWNSAKTALFPHPAGTVSLAGIQQSNRLVFRHTAGTYNLNAAAAGDRLTFTGTDPAVEIEREVRFNLPVSGGFTLRGNDATLRLTTDNSASLAGSTLRVASGQLRGQDGDTGVGNELGGATTTLIVQAGAQLRFFNVNQGTRNYPQTLRLAGTGFGNPGVLNNDSNAPNNILWSGPVILDNHATIASQNAATWTFNNIHDADAADKVLTLLQQSNITTITGNVSLGGLLKTGGGTLDFAESATATLGTLTLGGGTVRLNAPQQLAATTRVVFSNAGATLDITGRDQAITSLAGAGSITGAATLAVTGNLSAGAPGQQLNVTGNLNLTGAEWRISANGNATNRIAVQGNLNLSGTVIDVTVDDELTGEVYMIAFYGTRSGVPTLKNLPAGYTLDLAYNSGTAIALVSGEPAAGYASWAAANGIAGQPFEGDFDSDGISNGLEYALADLDPSAPDGSPGNFANGTIAFTKRPEASASGDVTYAIQTSTTLAENSWTTVTPVINNGTTISYTLPVGQGPIFARLMVATQP